MSNTTQDLETDNVPATEIASVPPKKSQEDIDSLKESWENDPCWDIWDTEGFEAHIDELKEYQETMEKMWSDEEVKAKVKANVKADSERRAELFTNLKLHKTLTIDSRTSVMRVVGGWIYTFAEEALDYNRNTLGTALSSVFVPKGDEEELTSMIKELLEDE